jgi:hypothetical protein
MDRIRVTLYLAAMIILSQGCRQNEEYITQQITPLNLGIRLRLENAQLEYNAYGAACTDEDSQIVRVSNKPELLSGDLNILDLESGDFILIKETVNGNSVYGIIYIYLNENDGDPELLVLIDELTELDSFQAGENYAEGSHSGSFISQDGTSQFEYDFAFLTELPLAPELCE